MITDFSKTYIHYASEPDVFIYLFLSALHKIEAISDQSFSEKINGIYLENRFFNKWKDKYPPGIFDVKDEEN